MDRVDDLSGHLPDLTALVNRQLAAVPPGWTMTSAQAGSFLRMPSAWAVHYPDPPPFAKRDLGVRGGGRLLAAGQYGMVEGYCHVAWLAADPGKPAALADWLAALEGLARAAGCREIADSRNELGIGWFGTPVAWEHLVRGLGKAGWEPGDRWVIMTGETVPAADPGDPPFRTLVLDRREETVAGEWAAYARVGDVPAADSVCWAPSGVFRDCPGWAEWMILEWIGVEEPFQRRGLGRWLFRTQMRWLADRGIRRVMLYTETGNLPARRLFESAGLTAASECWCLRKSLTGAFPVI